jgi:hypothetical protein
MLIAGRRGTGKSVLASAIARRWDRVLVYDPNMDPEALLPGAALCYGVDAALRSLPGRVVWRPMAAENDAIPELFDRLVRKVLGAGGAHGFVIHEVTDLGTSDRGLRPFTSSLLRTGRNRRTPVIGVTQRPVNVARLFISEAAHAAMFRLEDRDDRRRMAEILGPDVVPDALPADHSFWYRGPDLRLVRVAPLPYRAHDPEPTQSEPAREADRATASDR